MLHVVCILLTIGVFLLDLLTPLGFGAWLFYFFPLFIVSRTPRIRNLYIHAAFVTALVALGHLQHSGTADLRPVPAHFNRLLFVGVFWATAVILVQRLRILEKMDRATETLRAIVEGSPLAVIVLDPEGRVLLWNPAAERTFGWSAEEVMGRPVPTVPEGLRETFGDLVRRAFQGESFSNLEARGLRKDGSQVNLLISTSPLRDARGAIYGNLGVFTDITERKRAELALKETTRTLQELVRAAPVGITVLDPAGKVVLWNPSMERILGWSEDEVRGKALSICEDGEDGAGDTLERLRAGDRLSEVELRRARRDGRPVDMLLWTAPLREDRGRLKGTVVILLDVTQFKVMERTALRQQRMASLGEAAAGIAHEIRNPLSGINLNLNCLEAFFDGSEQPNPISRENAESAIVMMKKAAANMESVIERVLAFSRPGPPRMELLDVDHCIREAVDMVRASLRKMGVRVIIASPEGLPACRGDIRLLEQALINLVTNAAQAMEGREGERVIELRASRTGSAAADDRHVAISVADSGPGIPEELRERIFDPFFTTKDSGTGIGLSITHKIVADHGGFIRVGTSRWGGAVFTIILPAGDEG